MPAVALTSVRAASLRRRGVAGSAAYDGLRYHRDVLVSERGFYGVLRVKAVDEGSGWNYSVLQVEVPGQQPIDLRDRTGGSIPRELAPPTPDAPPPPMNDDGAPPPAEEGEERQDGDSDINL